MLVVLSAENVAKRVHMNKLNAFQRSHSEALVNLNVSVNFGTICT